MKRGDSGLEESRSEVFCSASSSYTQAYCGAVLNRCTQQLGPLVAVVSGRVTRVQPWGAGFVANFFGQPLLFSVVF